METFNADRKRNAEIHHLLQRIKYKVDKFQPRGKYVYFPISLVKGSKVKYFESIPNQVLFHELKNMGAIGIIERDAEEMNKTLKESAELKNQPLIVEGYLVKPIEPKFSQLCKRYEALTAEDQSGDLRPELKEKKQGKWQKNSVERLEVVRPKSKSNRFLIVVNKDYQKPIQGDRAKTSWGMLFEVAGGKELIGSEYKASLEYFNTNKRCKVYTQTGCSLTKIFKTEYYIVSAIPIEMISEKAFKQRGKDKSRKIT